jgi:lipid-binding SYLF domain-containing protein
MTSDGNEAENASITALEDTRVAAAPCGTAAAIASPTPSAAAVDSTAARSAASGLSVRRASQSDRSEAPREHTSRYCETTSSGR